MAVYEEDTPCYVSEEVDFISEYRCFFRHGEPVGVKHYRGSSFVPLDKTTYNKMAKACKHHMPAAYVLDMGVTADGRTLLIESNDAYAVGSYGLTGIVYARFLEARWVEITGG